MESKYASPGGEIRITKLTVTGRRGTGGARQVYKNLTRVGEQNHAGEKKSGRGEEKTGCAGKREQEDRKRVSASKLTGGKGQNIHSGERHPK